MGAGDEPRHAGAGETPVPAPHGSSYPCADATAQHAASGPPHLRAPRFRGTFLAGCRPHDGLP